MATVRQDTEEDAKWKNNVSANRQPHGSFPILDWFFGYQKEWLRWDLIAGLITAAVVIPKAMAYATIAGLPVQVGLYTVLVPMAVYAVVGTSRPLSMSTTTTLAILAAAQLGQVALAVRSGQSSQDTQRLTHPPVFGQRRSRGPA